MRRHPEPAHFPARGLVPLLARLAADGHPLRAAQELTNITYQTLF